MMFLIFNLVSNCDSPLFFSELNTLIESFRLITDSTLLPTRFVFCSRCTPCKSSTITFGSSILTDDLQNYEELQAPNFIDVVSLSKVLLLILSLNLLANFIRCFIYSSLISQSSLVFSDQFFTTLCIAIINIQHRDEFLNFAIAYSFIFVNYRLAKFRYVIFTVFCLI